VGVRVELFDEIDVPRRNCCDAIGLLEYYVATRDVDVAIGFADETKS
jgi:hypothetical protein